MKKRIFSTSLLLSVLLLSGCGSNNNSTENNTNKPNSSTVQGLYQVKVSAVGSTTIKATQTVTLRAQVVGTNEKDVTWTSSDDSIATVNNKGVVTGVAAGQAKIRATLNVDPNSYAEITITVEKADVPESVMIEGLTSNVGWVGESVQLSVSIMPEGAASSVVWSTSDNGWRTKKIS